MNHRAIEIIQSEEKKIEKKDKALVTYLCDNVKQTNIWVITVYERIEKSRKKYLNKGQNFPKIW